MSFTIGRMLTVATHAPRLLAAADKAGPSLRKAAALGVEIAGLLKDPAMKEFAQAGQALIAALDLGGIVPPAEVVTPKEAITRIAAGDISHEQQAQLDRASNPGGAG